MKYLMLVVILLGMSCRSVKKAPLNRIRENKKYLLTLSKEKDDGKVITYKGTSLKKVVINEKGDFKFYFGNKIIFEGSRNCLFLLEVFNNETILLSTSDTSDNIYAASPERFKRGMTFLINKETGDVKQFSLEEGFFFKVDRENLNKKSINKNVFAINNIYFDDNIIKLYENSGTYKETKLIKVTEFPLNCN